jgi:hypothetical protein
MSHYGYTINSIHSTSGISGVKSLMSLLPDLTLSSGSKAGRGNADVALHLLEQLDYPSWVHSFAFHKLMV